MISRLAGSSAKLSPIYGRKLGKFTTGFTMGFPLVFGLAPCYSQSTMYFITCVWPSTRMEIEDFIIIIVIRIIIIIIIILINIILFLLFLLLLL